MQVQLLFAGHQRERLIDVRHQLLGRGGLAGIVAGGLDAAGQRLAAVKAGHIVALPAVDGNGDVLQRIKRLFDIHAKRGVHLFCLIETFHTFFPFCYRK